MSVRQLITGKSDGPGSGNRWRYGAKSTTDDFRTGRAALGAGRCAEAGLWVGWQWTRDGETVASIQMRAEQDRVILIYRHRSGDGEWKDEHYAVRIVRTVQPRRFPRLVHLPGRRLWAARGDPLRGGIFACRRCYRLAYASSREDAGDRATRRAPKVRNRGGLRFEKCEALRPGLNQIRGRSGIPKPDSAKPDQALAVCGKTGKFEVLPFRYGALCRGFSRLARHNRLFLVALRSSPMRQPISGCGSGCRR